MIIFCTFALAKYNTFIFMASKLNRILSFLGHYKYLIVVVIGVAVVGFLDENSFLQRFKYEMQISDLRQEIAEYNAVYEADFKRLKELNSDPKAIEKVAREQYFMKADNEDIFVLETDIPQEEAADEGVK